AVAVLREELGGRVFLGGQSYGGRQASMLAAGDPSVADALILLSYPPHPPRKPAPLRTAHLPGLQTPPLFIQGTKDAFGTLQEIEQARALVPATTRLCPVANGGHGLVTKKNVREVAADIAVAFLDFLAAL